MAALMRLASIAFAMLLLAGAATAAPVAVAEINSEAWYAATGNEPAAGTAPELPPAEPPAMPGKMVGVLR